MPNAFTRIELATVIAAFTLLCALAAPLFGITRGDSQRASCFNNLRQIGAAVQVWGADHGQRVPWWTPVNEGGTLVYGKPANAWYEWGSLSNELKAPIILICPSDESARVAAGFNNGPDGFFNNAFRENAVSYIVGLHALFDYPDSIVSADRNLRSGAVRSCSTGILKADWMDYFTAKWTNAVHGPFGNVLLLDGRVVAMNTPALTNKVASERYRSFTHYLRAR